MTIHHLDARGLVCPLPVLKARKILLGLSPGELLAVSVTDSYAPKDFELFCAESGHILKSVESTGESTKVTVERGPQ